MISPLVSIIVPTYNDRDVVCDAIDCSLNQTYGNIEIIVIDDGSTDGTEQLLQEKYGSRIKCIHQKNGGLSSARNVGIRHASGKYLQFLDADDLIDHNKVRVQVEGLQNVSGIALAYCDYVRTAIGGAVINFEGRMSPVLQKEKPLDDLIMKWETEVSIPPHCFLFDAAFFKGYGIAFDESLPTHEDWECWMNVFALDPTVFFIDKPLADYRIRKASMCVNRLKMREGFLMAIDKQIQKNSPNKEVVMKLYRRKKQVKYLYQDVSPVMRIIERCNPIVKKIYTENVPWRIQRMFD
jgi:glycosyltransferase involved in cell wall biosynthesis